MVFVRIEIIHQFIETRSQRTAKHHELYLITFAKLAKPRGVFMKKQVKRLFYTMLVYTMLAFLPLLMSSSPTFAHDGKDGGTAVKVGDYSINLIFLEPATTGVNSFHVQVFDEMGTPIGGARSESIRSACSCRRGSSRISGHRRVRDE